MGVVFCLRDTKGCQCKYTTRTSGRKIVGRAKKCRMWVTNKEGVTSFCREESKKRPIKSFITKPLYGSPLWCSATLVRPLRVCFHLHSRCSFHPVVFVSLADSQKLCDHLWQGPRSAYGRKGAEFESKMKYRKKKRTPKLSANTIERTGSCSSKKWLAISLKSQPCRRPPTGRP